MNTCNFKNKSIGEEVMTTIAATFGIEKAQVTDELEYQSTARWDSLRHVALMVALENRFNVEIENEQASQLTSVLSIKNFIVAQLKGLKQEFTKKDKITVKDNELYRGLIGIKFDSSSITKIDGINGGLIHRGFDIAELSANSTFEEMTYLLINRELPTRKELAQFINKLNRKRKLAKHKDQVMKSLTSQDPIDALRTIISMLPKENSNKTTLDIGLSLISQIPCFIAMHYRLQNNKRTVLPHEKLSHVENFLYMLTGKAPELEEAKIFEKVMILHAEHGANASTFVARIATSTEADVYSAIIAAISTFSGSLHGGALQQVYKMIEEIGKPNRAKKYILNRLRDNLPVYGFGHRIYKTEDPRGKILHEYAKRIGVIKGNTVYINILEEINKVMKPYSKFGANQNVDFYAAAIYLSLKIPSELVVPIFIMSRISGWIAHILEQKENNILIRPSLHYIGPKERSYVSIDKRVN